MPPKGKAAKRKLSHRETTASTSAAVSGRIFPLLVIIEILSGLPVKTLLRFNCVCKQWRTLISLPSFTSAHLSRSPATPIIHAFKTRPIPIQPDDCHVIYTYCSPNPQSCRDCTINHIPNILGSVNHLQVVGSANGVVLMVQSQRPNTQEFTLWNPATRSYLHIPAWGLNLDPSIHSGVSTGLGFDPSLNEYKIIRLICYRKHHLTGMREPDAAEAFDFKTGRWTTLVDHNNNNNNNGVRFRVVRATCDAVIKGVPYWRASGDDANLGITMPMLLSLDVKNMVFNLEPFSWSLENKRMCMGEIKDGCLGVIMWDVTAKGESMDEDRVLDVLMKHERRGSWSRIYRVRLHHDELGRVVGIYWGGRDRYGIVQEGVDDYGKYLWMINVDEDDDQNERIKDTFYPDNSLLSTSFNKVVSYRESLTRMPTIGNA